MSTDEMNIAQYILFLVSELYLNRACSDGALDEEQTDMAKEMLTLVQDWQGDAIEEGDDWELEIPYSVKTKGGDKLKITVIIEAEVV